MNTAPKFESKSEAAIAIAPSRRNVFDLFEIEFERLRRMKADSVECGMPRIDQPIRFGGRENRRHDQNRMALLSDEGVAEFGETLVSAFPNGVATGFPGGMAAGFGSAPL